MSRLLVSAVLLLLSLGSSAQTWLHVIDYVPNTIGSSPTFYEIFPTTDGGFLVALQGGQLVKLDADGDPMWTKSLPDSLSFLIDAKADPNGAIHLMTNGVVNHIISLSNSGDILNVVDVAKNYEDFCATGDGYLLLSTQSSPDSTLSLLRLDLLGDTLWTQTYTNSLTLWYGYDVIQTMDGGFLASVFESHPDGVKHQLLVRTDANGAILWTSNAPTVEYFNPHHGQILENPDGSFVLMGPLSMSAAFYAIRLSAAGQVISEKTNFTFYAASDFAPAPDGGFWIIGTEWVGGVGRLYIRKLDYDFNVEWKRLYPLSYLGTFGERIAYSGGNSYAVFGYLKTGQNSFLPCVIHPDSSGNVQQNLISGQIRHDLDEDCVAEPGEEGLANWLVSTGIYYTLTDSLGKFEMYGGIGNTPIFVYPPLAYWQICPGFDTVVFTQIGDTAYLDIPSYSIVDCPYLEINIGVNRLRPCFESVFNVQYCNLGTVAADSATAVLVLPPEINFISSTLPVFQQIGDSLWFSLGTLGIGECGDFKVTVLVDCDSVIVGQTLCTEAYIFPDTLCFPITNWSGAEVKVSAQCINGQEVKFTIRNIGNATTDPSLQYLIIEDQVVLHQGPFLLGPDESIDFTEPADGSFWRISADQEPNFPTPSMPAAWVEGCGGFQSLGYVDDFFFDDAASSVDVECRVVTNSFDPNDKQASPEGYGDEHFIEPGTELTYLIRFQNTGTDTAFNVILRDTLDVWLDPASVRPGASSHPYEFEIVGAGVLKIWFKNIMLPDSNVNEPASNGFFQYRVKMKPNVPLGTLITNQAAIYFDFNAPIITNQTYHTVGKNFYTVSVEDVTSKVGVTLTVAPNPFWDGARFLLENAEVGKYDLRVFDAHGNQVRLEKFTGREMIFRRNGLPAGVYFFEIRQDGQRIAAGKMTAL